MNILIPVLVIIICIFIYFKFFTFAGTPEKMYVFSGRKHKNLDGEIRGYAISMGEKYYMIPIIEEVQAMDLTPFPVEIKTGGIWAKGHIWVQSVEASGSVKISTDPVILDAAIEHFLGQSEKQLAHVASETLEGNLRNLVSEKDIGSIPFKIKEEIQEDFDKLGFQLVDFKIDKIDYEK
jgi:flotillin